MAAVITGCAAPAPVQVAPEQPVELVPRLGVNALAIQVQFVEGDTKTVTKNIVFMNEGDGVLMWAARKTEPWIWMDEMDGVLERGSQKNLQVYISPNGKTAGTYSDNVSIEGARARNSPQMVQVTMTITPAAPVVSSEDAVVRKPVPLPPWDYTEYKNGSYNFRLRYPREYQEKPIIGTNMAAICYAGKPTSDMIMLTVTSSYGVDQEDVSFEVVKAAVRAVGGKPNPKLVSSDNITLLDGATNGFEYLYESKTATTGSYQVLLRGVRYGNRFIIFSGISSVGVAQDKIPRWREIADTLEFVGKD